MTLLISTALFYPSRLGGPANTLYWLSKALAKAGVQVTVVTTGSHIELGKIVPDKVLQRQRNHAAQGIMAYMEGDEGL